MSVPFFNLAGVYEGPVAKALGDVDISWAPGLLVAAVAYYMLMRNVDMAKEQPSRRGKHARARSKTSLRLEN